jgi:hypothetical protein
MMPRKTIFLPVPLIVRYGRVGIEPYAGDEERGIGVGRFSRGRGVREPPYGSSGKFVAV